VGLYLYIPYKKNPSGRDQLERGARIMTDLQKINYALAVAFARGHISGDQVANILKLMGAK